MATTKRQRKPRKGPHIYWRPRAGGRLVAYADLRGIGGAREALIPDGDASPTDDPEIAAMLLAEKVEKLREKKRDRVILGYEDAPLGRFASQHLLATAGAGEVTTRHIAETETQLRRAVEFFGEGRPLGSIGVEDIERFRDALGERQGRGGRTLSQATVRKHLNAISKLYKRAQSRKLVRPGYCPVSSMLEKPVGSPREAVWLEPGEAALLLEAARLYEHPTDRAPSLPFAYPLIGFFLLTGTRKAEALGTRIEDVSFDRGIVRVGPNQWRRLKTRKSRREIQLWPQLRTILLDYLNGPNSPDEHPSGLLFPSPRSGGMVDNVRRVLDRIGLRIGWESGTLRTKAFRHTYASARLQTLDRGEPVALWTVARELGHSGTDQIEETYGHHGRDRHRAEVVEFRPESYPAAAELEIERAAQRGETATVERLRNELATYRRRLAGLRAA